MYNKNIIRKKNNKLPVVMQHYCTNQIYNGGPATGALLVINSKLKEKYAFVPLEQTFAPHGINLKLLHDLYKKIKRVKPDILHIRGLQSEGFYGVLAGKLAGCKKIVVSIHGLYSDDLSCQGFKKWVFLNILEPLTLKMADLVYCVCEYATKREIIYKNASHLFGYIWNAAPDYSQYNKEEIRKQVRKYLKINDRDIVVITVSRISKDKGLDYFVDAIKEINTNNNIKFLIVGDGPYLNVVKENLADEIMKGDVVLIGKSDKVPELLLSSDIFVFPSLHENLSNALLEACAASLPCIATNVGGNPEVIIHDQTGILIDPYNSMQLKEAIETLVESERLRSEYGRRAYERIRKNFSQEIIIEKIDSMYSYLLNDQHKHN